MIQQFYPDEWLDSAYVIDYEKLYKEGYRGLIFDIDNTWYPMALRLMSGPLLFLSG